MTISPLDITIIVLYILGCTILGARLGSSVKGLKGYFLGENNIPAWAVMISIVATETSTATFLSVPAIVFKPNGNFTYLQLAIGYFVGRIIVSVLLLPSYFRGEIYTAYQVLQTRFGGATKTTASVLFLITRTLADGLRLYLAAIVLQQILVAMNLQQLNETSLSLAVLGMGAATIVYTFLGGMKAVIWTDVIQFFVYLVGAVVALFLIVGKIPGGWSGLWEAGSAAHKFRLFDFHFDLTQPYTFWSGLIGGLFLCTATHGADQMMVQRYLSARSQRQAAAALISSGVVVMFQFALFLTIGAALFVLYEHTGQARPAPDRAFIDFIVHNMKTGLLGLVLAAIFSAAMSTLSSSLNASASATLNDLYRPMAPERHRGASAPPLEDSHHPLGSGADGCGPGGDPAQQQNRGGVGPGNRLVHNRNRAGPVPARHPHAKGLTERRTPGPAGRSCRRLVCQVRPLGLTRARHGERFLSLLGLPLSRSHRLALVCPDRLLHRLCHRPDFLPNPSRLPFDP